MEKELKTERMQLRLTPTDQKNIAYHAKMMNISKNEYILLALRRRRIVICDDFPELIYQLSKIGNNINQIAAIANKNQYISVNNVDATKELMEQCHNLLNQFIDFIVEPERDYLKNDTSKICEILEDMRNSMQFMNNRLLKLENKLE